MLVDTWSSADIIFKDTLDSLNIENLKIEPFETSLYGFAESYILPISENYYNGVSSVGFKNVILIDFGKAFLEKNKSSGKHTLLEIKVQIGRSMSDK